MPLLATAWEYPDPTTIDFTLRPGVKFHNGDPFTADDVVYTIQSILTDPKAAVPGNFAFIAGAEKLGDMKVRVKLKTIFPAALEYFAMTLPIYPKAYREKVGGERYSKAPIGTGPYRSPPSTVPAASISSGSKITTRTARRDARRSSISRSTRCWMPPAS